MCHFGPQFTNGEFDKTGIPVGTTGGRFDWGRYDGIKTVLASRFNRLTPHNDDRSGADTISTQHVVLNLEAYGAFKVPGLRNVALTAPYMHNGGVATLEETVERELYYRGLTSNRPLILTSNEKEDLVEVLRSLTSEVLPR